MKAATADDPYAAMLRGAGYPALVASAGAVAVCAVLGVPELLGALIASAVVLVFFASTLLVLRAFRDVAPAMVLGLAMLTYTTKVAVIGAAVLSLRDASWLSGTAFAVTALVVAVVWLAGEVRGFARARVLVSEPAPQDDGHVVDEGGRS